MPRFRSAPPASDSEIAPSEPIRVHGRRDGRGLAGVLPVLAVLLATAALSCAPESDPHPIVPLEEAVEESPEAAAARVVFDGPGDFRVSRAWRDLEILLADGPRPPGSDAARRARRYLREQLEAAGLATEEVVHGVTRPARAAAGEPSTSADFTSLVARLGAGVARPRPADILLFVAPYTSPAGVDGAPDSVPGANEGASGAVVLVEAARTLAEREAPAIGPDGAERYEMWFAFVSGDGTAGDPIAGSRSLAEALRSQGVLDRVRAGFFLDRVADADLRIARDLFSSRSYREEVWRTARALGHAERFASDGFETPMAGHRAFQAAGVRQMVALVDPLHGSGAPPGAFARTPADSLANCSSQSIAAVGAVLVDAVRTAEARLAQIDRYAEAPAAVTAADALERAAAGLPEEPAGGGSGQPQGNEVDIDGAMSETTSAAEAAPGEAAEASPAAAVPGEES